MIFRSKNDFTEDKQTINLSAFGPLAMLKKKFAVKRELKSESEVKFDRRKEINFKPPPVDNNMRR